MLAAAALSCALALSRVSLSRGAEVAHDRAPAGALSDQFRARLVTAYGKLAPSFEPNQGQTDSRVRFLAHGRGYTLFLTSTEAVLSLRKPSTQAQRSSAQGVQPVAAASGPKAERAEYQVLRMKLEGAKADTRAVGLDELPGRSNYFIGSDSKKWRTNIPNYAGVRFEQVYTGVDLVYHASSQQELEYDFVVAPGTDPGVIELGFEGAKSIALDRDGSLIVRMASGVEFRQPRPPMYQEIGGKRQEVAGGYALRDGSKVGFRVAAYDKHAPLLIDPFFLVYSTLLSGSNGRDDGTAIAVDGAGNAYVTGIAELTDFPTTSGAYQTTLQGGLDASNAFVAKLDPMLSGIPSLVYTTYLGGPAASTQGTKAPKASASQLMARIRPTPTSPALPV